MSSAARALGSQAHPAVGIPAAQFRTLPTGRGSRQTPPGQSLATGQSSKRVGTENARDLRRVSSSLAQEINHAVKTFDRGIHYWHVGSDASRLTCLVFGVYGALSLLVAYIGFRGEALDRGMATAAVGIAIGLGLAAATTWLLTGYLWGVSVTDLTTFVVSATTVAGIVLFASLVGWSALPSPAVHPVDARRDQTGW